MPLPPRPLFATPPPPVPPPPPPWGPRPSGVPDPWWTAPPTATAPWAGPGAPAVPARRYPATAAVTGIYAGVAGLAALAGVPLSLYLAIVVAEPSGGGDWEELARVIVLVGLVLVAAGTVVATIVATALARLARGLARGAPGADRRAASTFVALEVLTFVAFSGGLGSISSGRGISPVLALASAVVVVAIPHLVLAAERSHLDAPR